MKKERQERKLGCRREPMKRQDPERVREASSGEGRGHATEVPDRARQRAARAPVRAQTRANGGGSVKQQDTKLSVLKYLSVMNSNDGTLTKHLFNAVPRQRRAPNSLSSASIPVPRALLPHPLPTASAGHKTVPVPLQCLCPGPE